MPTRQRLVAVAADLLQLRGYAGTGIAEILERSGTTKGSLYFHFPGGKEELAAEALRVRGTEIGRLIEHLASSAPDAATTVCAFAVALATRLEDSEFQRGCALATAVLDAGPDAATVREAARGGYDRWRALLADRIAADGLVDDPASEALLVISALEGALILARAQRDPGPVLDVAKRITSQWRERTGEGRP
ncbi:TetR/AcrR family transcriptional regulator [Nocardia sp. NPDC050710]|uniref:TetR/AcrR family transcriptional regulator n=1 Tax=Nocardia sp. NPDC050710 TaxID=3157220 RepID=UPI0033C35AAA